MEECNPSFVHNRTGQNENDAIYTFRISRGRSSSFFESPIPANLSHMNGFRTTQVRKATRLVRNDGFGRISPSKLFWLI